MKAFHEQQVVRIAKDAGAIIADGLAKPFERHKKPDGSTVTSIDYAADAFIKQQLQRMTPDIPILSEEDPLDQQQACMKKGIYWCIDPLDGTSSACAYADGDKARDYFGVLIGLVKDGVPVFGVAHYPMKDNGLTYFTNAEGTQAFRQRGEHGARMPIRVHAAPQRPLRHYARAEGVRQIGDAAVAPQPIWGNSNLAIAEGTLDIGYYPHHVQHPPGYWDVAAPHAILRAAGGEIFTAPATPEALSHEGLGACRVLRYDAHGFVGNDMPYVAGGLAGSAAALTRAGLATPETSRAR